MNQLFDMAKDTYMNFRRDQGVRMAAAIAFLSILSLVPIVIFAIMIGQAVIGDAALQNDVIPQVEAWFGERAAEAVRQAFQSAEEVTSLTLAALFSLGLLAYSASTVFYELQKALNNVWGVQRDPEEKSFRESVEKRAFSFAIVLLVGALLIILLTATGILWGVQQDVDSAAGGFAVSILNLFITWLLAFAIMALIYKYIPEVKVSWNVIVPPAMLAALAYVIGLKILQIYLANSTTGSIYQTLGAVALALIWLFYSAEVLFVGAEVTAVYAKYSDETVEVDQGVKVLDDSRLPTPG